MNIVLTGGGTAGHVFPALAVAGELRDSRGASVTFIGAADGQEARLVPDAGFPFLGLRVRSAQSRLSPATVGAVALAFRGARACRATVANADVVVSIGGFASASAVLAARRTRRMVVARRRPRRAKRWTWRRRRFARTDVTTWHSPPKRGTPYVTVEETRRFARFGSY